MDRQGRTSSGLGETLQTMFERERSIAQESEKGRPAETALMNPIRRKLLETVCRNPCITISELAREAGLSLNNTKWHLKVLQRNGYVEIERIHGATVSYPGGLLDGRLREVLSTLNASRSRETYLRIAHSSGMTTGQLRTELGCGHRSLARSLDALEKINLIARLRDGRHIRCFTTEEMTALDKQLQRRFRGFRTHLMKRFVSEHLSPEVVRADSSAFIVNLKVGKTIAVLNIHIGL